MSKGPRSIPLTLGFFLLGGIGRDRKPVERTRQTHPYSFDDYLSFESTDQPLANESLYTDRMWQHEPQLYESLMQKHFGTSHNFWEGRSPEKIEAFLRDYCSEPDLQLVRVWTCCDHGSGAEQWQFEFLSQTRPLPAGYVGAATKVTSKSTRATKAKSVAAQTLA